VADKGVNEDLYNWINKSYGLQPAEWYRNNPQKPSESNPFLPKGSYVPKASADDPYRGAVASTQDPYRDPLQPGATEKQPLFSTTNVKTINDYTQEELATLPFDQLLRALANTPEGTEDKSGLGLDYEGFVSSLQGQPSFFGATVPQGVQLDLTQGNPQQQNQMANQIQNAIDNNQGMAQFATDNMPEPPPVQNNTQPAPPVQNTCNANDLF